MKKIFSVIILSIIMAMSTYGQSISPNENTEFCPLTSTTFTVTLPRIATGTTPTVTSWTNTPILISGVNNINHSATQTTFTFVGQFRDVNIHQVFRVDYVPNGGSATFYEAKFKRVKSFFYGACTPIQPNQVEINAPRCQISSHSISFNNLQWKTEFETPSLCFGSITNYEYLLPAGWSLNGTTSNGASWIAGDNNEIITSDASSGNGAVIRIRPINTQCGIGLNAGQQVQIPISRLRPPLSISGDDVICSGTVNYTVAGTLPPGATVCWTISSPNGAATIPSSPFCGTTLPVSYNTVGSATITATITDCIETYSLTPKVVVLGTPALPAPGGLPAFNLIGQRFDYGANGPGNSFSVCTYEALTFTPYFPFDYPYASITAHQWTITGNYSFASSLNQGSLSVLSAATHPNAFQFTYRYQNACGWSPYYYGQAATMNCDGGEEPFRGELESLDFTISPNPANNYTTLQLTGINSSFEVRVFNVMTSKLERLQSFEKGQTQVRLNLGNLQNGNYVIHITSNGITKSKQLKILR